MNTSLSLIIPAYNEEDGIDAVLRGTIKFLDESGENWEIIVVDDGSKDNTTERLSAWGAQVKTIRHSINRGYGASLKTGLQAAQSEWVAILDADGTYPIERLSDLLNLARTEDLDMVVGSRTGNKVKIPYVRRPAKWILRQLASALSGSSIPDLNSGMRVFKRKTIESYLAILPDTFSFTTTSTIAMLCDNRSIDYISIDYYSRSGTSKIKPISDTYRFVMLILRTTIYFKPLRVFAPASFILIFLSFMMLLYRAIVHQAFEVTSVVLFMVGVQMLALGLLGDLINNRNRDLKMSLSQRQ